MGNLQDCNLGSCIWLPCYQTEVKEAMKQGDREPLCPKLFSANLLRHDVALFQIHLPDKLDANYCNVWHIKILNPMSSLLWKVLFGRSSCCTAALVFCVQSLGPGQWPMRLALIIRGEEGLGFLNSDIEELLKVMGDIMLCSRGHMLFHSL